MFRARFLSLAFLVSTALVGNASAAAVKCDAESIAKITPADAVIDSVKHIDAPVAHCEVLGHIITQNPGPNRVEWSVMLPDSNFLGRYYVIGQGAAAGNVLVANNPNNIKLLSNGFAVSSSDTGHKGSMWDFGVNNPTARLDHGHRGAHVSAVATQAITKAYYGMKDKLYRYHLGCSGGGRMGAMAALHHPEDFDGIVASTGWGNSGANWFPWILQNLVNNPEMWISPEKLATLERKVAEKCAGPDGLVRDPNACGFDVATLQCKGPSTNECLTAAEINMAKIVTGRHPAGPGITGPGFTLTNPTGWSSFLLGNTKPTSKDVKNPWAPAAAPSSYGIAQSILRGFYFDDANFDLVSQLDFKNKEMLDRMKERHPGWSAVDANLSGFKKAGGKMIMWAPLGENAVPPGTEFEYFEDLKKTVPDRDDFVRLYVAPGVWHCGGGIGPQDVPDRLLEKVISWAEQGRRPDAVWTSAAVPRAVPGPAGAAPALTAPPPSRTVLLCPHPQTAVFSGKKGAFPYDADNWKCQ